LTGWGGIRAWAAAVVAGFFLLHGLGLQAGRAFQNVVTAIKVVLLLVIVAAGFLGGSGAAWVSDMALSPERGLLLGFALAYQSISFTYYGADDAIKLAEEIREPERRLPRILILGSVGVLILYMAINIAFLSALTPTEMQGSALVAADAVAIVLGETGRVFITVTALVILFSSLNVNFLGVPRVAYGLSSRGLAPRAFQRVTGGGTPIVGLLLITGLVLLLAMTRSFEFLIRFMMFVAITIDAGIVLALFRLRSVRPKQLRPYEVRWYPVLPGMVLILLVAIIVLITATQPELAIGGLSLIAALVIAGILWQRARDH
jgi:amino acid transporter